MITPIGHAGSNIRNRVDQWMELIYKPSLSEKYEIVRADQIDTPGIITEQIIDYIIKADLVIIDYTDLNPNVMYEAAIRHLTNKPYIQLYEKNTKLPFDIQNIRSSVYDQENLNYPKELVKIIKDNLKEIEKEGYSQPKITTEKFDFENIVKDPEKFIALLKKHFVYPEHKRLVIGDSDSITYVNDLSFAISGRKTIKCPRCGTIKNEGLSAFVIAHTGTLMNGYYKCNACGNTFQP